MAGSLGRLEKTGASVVRPCGDQKPLVVKSVSAGEGRCSSLISWKMFAYCSWNTHTHAHTYVHAHTLTNKHRLQV